MNVTAATLENLLRWSEPKSTVNARGQRIVRTAVPTGEFWKLWRSNRDEIYGLGCNPKLLAANNEWQVIWYQDAAKATLPIQPALVTPTVVIPTPSVVPATPSVAKTSMRWSDEQEAIFAWFKTPTAQRSLVVTARAGTGKTTTIKAAFSMAPEDRMLYAVFNKKNQVEATEAITDPRVEIKTLHSLGYMFIQQVWPNVKPTDEVEKERVDKACGELAPREVKTQVRKLVGFAKNTLIDTTIDAIVDIAEERDVECPQFEAEINGGWTVMKLAVAAMKVMELSKELDPQGRISFNDMVWLPVTMGWVRAWFDLVVVDEAQDMSKPQLMMAKGACRENGRICVVGDDRQAIYHFRGAASDGMEMMVNELAATKLPLTITYRCPKAVVKLAAEIVPDYRAADSAPDGIVEHALGIGQDVALGDAILSRSNAPLMPICLSLLRRGIRACIEGKDLGKQLLEVVKKINAPTVPMFMTRIETWSEKQIARFRNTKNFDDKCEELNDIASTLRAIAEGAASVREIETRITTLFRDSNDANDKDAKLPKVTLSTVHKAKGLEWTKVFILKSTFNRKRPANAAPVNETVAAARAKEEANIYYVALTRAKNHLVLVAG